MRMVGICSGGGHLTELMAVANSLPELTAVITEKNTAKRNKFVGIKLFPLIDPHRSFPYFLINFGCSFFLSIKLRPSVVLSTGAGMTIPFFFLSRVFGARTIFIESGARVTTPSLTGRFCYFLSDLFIIQSHELLHVYPKAVVCSIIPNRDAMK